MAPVHLPAEHNWLLFVISVVNLCLYIYDSSSCTTKAYRTIFDTIKEKCIRNELHCILMRIKLSSRRTIGASVHLNVQSKEITPIVVYLPVFLKWLLFSSGSHCSRTLNEAPRNEMASDLLNLASSLRSENDVPEVFQWMANGKQASDKGESPKSRLDMELGKAGLTYRHPPTSKDGNCLFHAMNDQLIRLGRVSHSATKVRCELVNYLHSNPTIPEGTHFRKFIKHGSWDTYLRRTAMDGEWGDWIALWGLINMFEIPVAVVSSLGETGLNIIDPGAGYENEATGEMALLGHEAELHYHSLEPIAAQNPQVAIAQELKQKYGERKIAGEICPRCGRKFECYTQGVFKGGGALQVYANDSVFCNSCLMDDF